MASMCPHCGKLFARKNAVGLIPVHDGEEWDKGQCPGSEQAARNSESDRRPLWRDDPEFPGRTATVKPIRTDATPLMNDDPREVPEQPKAKGGLTRDPELQAINRIMSLLASLPSDAVRQRVVAYVHVRTQEQTAKADPCV